MHKGWHRVSIISNIETRVLEAWLGGAHLWSTLPQEPGSADEVAEFFTVTLIRLLEVVEGMSAHERMHLLARIAASCTAQDDLPPHDVLGPFPA
ncbi:hypothetical protein [Pseudoroseicyclus tamaricis]|uniref:Uncharacterized protein n=1 Tax=Pseudoroseicyclus tamaricis TaxID=2705421 RepID=A0A6B2JWZ8_9RHOB|nr:hypothetical protein [Pseudoroseicyclus tamaricis]NDU99881.1 hypothetical protein [Pseudoroseicyclus tamaricis]